MRQLFSALIVMGFSLNIWSMSFPDSTYSKRAALAVSPEQVVDFFKEFPELEQPMRNETALYGRIATIKVLSMQDVVYLGDAGFGNQLKFKCALSLEVGYRDGPFGKDSPVVFEASVEHSDPNVCKDQFVRKHPQTQHMKITKKSQVPDLMYEEEDVAEYQKVLTLSNQIDVNEEPQIEGLRYDVDQGYIYADQ